MAVKPGPGGQSWKLRDHISIYMQETENKLEIGNGYKFSKPAPSDTLPLAKLQRFHNFPEESPH